MGQQQGGSSLQDLLNQYSTIPGPQERAGNQLLSDQASRLKAAGLPTFEDLFNSFLDVSNRSADQQVAALKEQYGSRGQRYGSDILKAQGTLRENIASDQRAFANQALLGLEQSRQGLLGQLIGGYQASGAAEIGRSESAFNRLFSEFLRRSSPPPLLGAGLTFASNFGPTATVAY